MVINWSVQQLSNLDPGMRAEACQNNNNIACLFRQEISANHILQKQVSAIDTWLTVEK